MQTPMRREIPRKFPRSFLLEATKGVFPPRILLELGGEDSGRRADIVAKGEEEARLDKGYMQMRPQWNLA